MPDISIKANLQYATHCRDNYIKVKSYKQNHHLQVMFGFRLKNPQVFSMEEPWQITLPKQLNHQFDITKQH